MHEFARDLRLAVRGVIRRPGYALAVVATLAIGIGANTAIYSVFNWVLFRPLPGVSDPDALVTVRFQGPDRKGQYFVSYRDYADLRDGVAGFEGLAFAAPRSVDLALPGAIDPARTSAELVTANYLSVLGVRPPVGRDFSPAEEQPGGAAPGAIISRRLWRTLFDMAPSAIGREITINGHAFTVVGVAPAAFQGRSLTTATDLWLPFGTSALVDGNASADIMTNRRSTITVDAYGRLRPGVTLAQAQEQALAVMASGDFAGRSTRRNTIEPVLYPGIGRETYTTERLTLMFNLIMGAVGLVLILACANAANLLLARAFGRRREIAVCQAIGASRFQIIRQQLAEGLVLAAAAGAAGLVLSVWLTSLFDGMRLSTMLPAVEGVSIDTRVVLFTLAVSLLTGLVFAAAPAVASSRVDFNTSLKDVRGTPSRSRKRISITLAVVQVAVSVMLLVGAGLLLRSLSHLRALDLGMDPVGLVSFSANPPRQGYTPERAQQYFRDTLDRLRQVRGVESAAFSWTTPYKPMVANAAFTVPGAATKYVFNTNTVSRGFFATMGIPLVSGRDFSEAESLASSDRPGVAVVSERLARDVFPGGAALGRRIVLEYPKGTELEIVGIVGDVRGRPLTDEPKPYIYTPAGQARPATWGMVHVRSSLPFPGTADAIRQVARDLNPLLPPYDVEPFTASIDAVLAEQRLLARLTAVFASVAALLAAIGIYGMMAGAVAERRREFGIRLALGARARVVLGMVLRGAVMVSGAGVIAGVAGSVALRRTIEARLYGVTSSDPLTIAVACAALMGVAVLASLVPAIRASRVDPVSSLRVDA